ncbi:MAG: hypothetical protein R3288_01020 [Woeseiaceae bacterium]|nr:hypothetical protein [Woeseiaceae bacterium]
MRVRAAQFMNEIVSITVLLLMCLALIASPGRPGRDSVAVPSASPIEAIEIDFSFRHEGE